MDNEKAKMLALVANVISSFGILDQIIHTYKLKRVDQISWMHTLTHVATLVMWVIFNYMNKLNTAFITTLLLLILYLVALFQKIYYNNVENFEHDETLSRLKNVSARVQRSDISGVGLFAIKDLPKNTIVFPVNNFTVKTYKKNYVRSQGVTNDVINMFDDYWCSNSDEISVHDDSYHLYPSFFLNHSRNPNIINDGTNWVTLTNIKKGDELLEDYNYMCKDYDQTNKFK